MKTKLLSKKEWSLIMIALENLTKNINSYTMETRTEAMKIAAMLSIEWCKKDSILPEELPEEKPTSLSEKEWELINTALENLFQGELLGKALENLKPYIKNIKKDAYTLSAKLINEGIVEEV